MTIQQGGRWGEEYVQYIRVPYPYEVSHGLPGNILAWLISTGIWHVTSILSDLHQTNDVIGQSVKISLMLFLT